MFDQMKDLMKLQQQANQIKKKLENIHVEAESEGVVVVIDGNMTIIRVEISDDAWARGKDHICTAIKDATQKGLKKAQEVAASNMQEIMGSMGLPQGMFGGNKAA